MLKWAATGFLLQMSAVSIKGNVEMVLCISHLMLFTFPSLDCCCSYVNEAANNSAYEAVISPDVLRSAAST